MRAIDADALIHELNNSHYPGAPYVDAGISIAIGKVCDAPTIEPQPEIIRCKDCKYRHVDGDNVRFNVCELNHNKVQSDEWYCADAERRTDERTD